MYSTNKAKEIMLKPQWQNNDQKRMTKEIQEPSIKSCTTAFDWVKLKGKVKPNE